MLLSYCDKNCAPGGGCAELGIEIITTSNTVTTSTDTSTTDPTTVPYCDLEVLACGNNCIIAEPNTCEFDPYEGTITGPQFSFGGILIRNNGPNNYTEYNNKVPMEMLVELSTSSTYTNQNIVYTFPTYIDSDSLDKINSETPIVAGGSFSVSDKFQLISMPPNSPTDGYYIFVTLRSSVSSSANIVYDTNKTNNTRVMAGRFVVDWTGEKENMYSIITNSKSDVDTQVMLFSGDLASDSYAKSVVEEPWISDDSKDWIYDFYYKYCGAKTFCSYYLTYYDTLLFDDINAAYNETYLTGWANHSASLSRYLKSGSTYYVRVSISALTGEHTSTDYKYMLVCKKCLRSNVPIGIDAVQSEADLKLFIIDPTPTGALSVPATTIDTALELKTDATPVFTEFATKKSVHWFKITVPSS